MSASLDAAAREVARRVAGLAEILRVDVTDQGTILLTAAGATATRWFAHSGEALTERFPERDPALPLSQALDSFPGWRVLSYRPGRRMVVAVPRSGRTEVLKGHRRARSARAARNQAVAEGAMGRGAFRVPRLLRHDEPNEALVFEHLAGSEVELDAASAPLYHRLGQHLAAFQRDPGAMEREVFGPREELAVLAVWARKVEQAGATLPAGWAEARARLESTIQALPTAVIGLAHRDLHDRQVHLVDGEVALLDFDLLCRADVALDPGNLIAHLHWRALQGLHGAEPRSVRACVRSFLDGLGRTHESDFAKRLSFYSASTSLRLALVYRLRPRWSSLVDELVVLASTALDELDR